MSNFPDAHKVYELAAVFRERVIEQGRSFLWPDQEIWTDENAERLLEFERHHLSEAGEQKIEQVASAIRKESVTLCMLAADTQAACHFYWAATQGTTSRLLNAFTHQDALPKVDGQTLGSLLDQSPAALPSSYTFYRGNEFIRHLSAVTSITALRKVHLLAPNVDTIEDAITEEMNLERSGRSDLRFVWQIAHVLYPKQIAPVAAEYTRKRLIRRYRDEVRLDPNRGEFAQIHQIQRHLNAKLKRDDVSFYDPEVFLDWETDPVGLKAWKRWGPGAALVETSESASNRTHLQASISRVVDEKAPIYEITRLFQNRVIEQSQSLLWPNEDLWSDQNINQFLIDFRDMPVEKGKSWLQIYESHLLDRDPNSAKILADSYAYLMQFPSLDTLSQASKSATLHKILGWTRASTPDEETLDKVNRSFGLGIGSPGQYFSINVQYQLAFIPGMVRNLRNRSDDYIRDVAKDTSQELKNSYSFSKSVLPAANVMLHFLEPENFERIASQSDKIQIVERFSEQLEGIDSGLDADVDAEIRLIRDKLAGTHFDRDFDFYDGNVKPYWQGNASLGPGGPGPTGPDDDSIQPLTISDLSGQTYLDESFLREIDELLRDKQQLIFEGPPGSGKTFVARKFARYFTKQAVDSSAFSEQIELVQFHQSYSYEDFIEGIRPRTNDDGQLVYADEPGVFQKFANKAKANPEKKFVLIIDEINRGNVSRILGELMLLLEYRDESATLPYSKKPLTIPPNLYIIGTMNSADRSLSQIDYALRRRFYFVPFKSVAEGKATVLARWLNQKIADPTHRSRILRLFIELNTRLSQHLETDDLQVGHSYFMDEEIVQEAQLQLVWKYAILPLIREYLYHHRERDELLRNFELSSFDTTSPHDTEQEIDESAPESQD